VTQERKAITGSGNFQTSWTYNSADLPVTMIYPGNNNYGAGETVTFTYHPQMLLNTASNGTITYVKGVTYDAAGRTDLLSLGLTGSSPRVNVDYEYNEWDVQGGRLQYLKAGTVANPISLQNLTYTYDNNGNSLTIVDGYNSSQKQCFTYDELNRLYTAKAGDSTCSGTVGNGEYADETYHYNFYTGNLSVKSPGGTYTYSTTHKHAVVSTTGGWTFGYDGNGNMTSRNVGTAYTYGYDAENRLTTVSGGTAASFVYDGDGARVKGTAGGATTAYVGNYFEWTGSTSTMKKYYYAGSTRIAVRTGTADPLWLLGDHLGSTSQTAYYDGTAYTNGWQLYKPWGEKRYPSGDSAIPTTYRYTGQRQENYINLYWYGSRWYDDSLGRFIQPDTIVPLATQGVQAFDRFAYSNNNPVLWT
jgi:RHS repeat-associated protein